jgi:phenylpyruvate tautomerase PptA (4-oxalocrotonate tautomerase family)
MPLVRIEMLEGRPDDYRRAVSDAVHRALVETMGVTEDDRFQLITEHSAENFSYARPAVAAMRTDRLVVISITLNLGRTPTMKRAFYQRVVDLLRQSVGLAPDDVFIGLVEVDPDNWFVV